MDLFVIIAQVVKDLLGSLNPFRLFNSDYRLAFREHWHRSGILLRVGYVLGVIGLIVLVWVVCLGVWHVWK